MRRPLVNIAPTPAGGTVAYCPSMDGRMTEISGWAEGTSNLTSGRSYTRTMMQPSIGTPVEQNFGQNPNNLPSNPNPTGFTVSQTNLQAGTPTNLPNLGGGSGSGSGNNALQNLGSGGGGGGGGGLGSQAQEMAEEGIEKIKSLSKNDLVKYTMYALAIAGGIYILTKL